MQGEALGRTVEQRRARAEGRLRPVGEARVATGRGNTVVVFDAESYEVLATIPVGQRVWGLAVTADGKKLYAANSLSNEVSVIDTATNRVLKNIKTGTGRGASPSRDESAKRLVGQARLIYWEHAKLMAGSAVGDRRNFRYVTYCDKKLDAGKLTPTSGSISHSASRSRGLSGKC